MSSIFNKSCRTLVLAAIAWLMSSCGKINQHTNPEVHIHLNRLTVTWNGVVRIKGILPVLENAGIRYHEVHVNEKDTITSFEFLHNFKDHVQVTSIISPAQESVVFYLSPNNFHTQKARDFVGLVFQSIPGHKSGSAIFASPESNVLTCHSVQTINTFREKGEALILIRYNDNSYGAFLPLNGKGYAGSIGKFGEEFCVKSYHSRDGHSEKQIPVFAVAFAKDPVTAVKKVFESSSEHLSPDYVQLPESVLQEMYHDVGYAKATI